MNSRWIIVLLSAVISPSIAGCGSTLPILDIAHQGTYFDDYVQHIAAHVQCELRHAVIRTSKSPERSFLKKWAAKVELTIHAMDKGTVAPSVLDTAGTFLFGATGSVESDGTREISVTYFLPFDELINAEEPLAMDNDEQESCEVMHAEPIAGHLGIKEGLQASLKLVDSANIVSDQLSQPFDTITEDITFQVIYGGSINPSWKFVNVSVNNSGSLLAANRTHSDHLIITMGPTQIKDNPRTRHKTASREVFPSGSLNESFFVNRLRRSLNTIP